ncbi:hypothetical protein H2203_005211 [Taxawa tesnikishii (nom. ined.)]|nr:hypothetical protein H2203_005211 [Dothideales sp. JES 119]
MISSSSIEAWLSDIAAANITSTVITSDTNATFAAHDCQFVIGRALNKKRARTHDQITPVKQVRRTSLNDEQVLSTKPQERLHVPLAFMDPNERTVRRSARTPSTSKKKKQGLDAILQEQDQQESTKNKTTSGYLEPTSDPRSTTSPIKSGGILRYAEKPIIPARISVQNTPPDVKSLLRRISDIDFGLRIIPNAVQDAVMALLEEEGQELREQYLRHAGENDNGDERELEALTEIYNNAKDMDLCFEAAWNEAVHYPLLRLALKPFSKLKVHNVTRAPICPAFMPRYGDGIEQLESKMVDYTINLLPRTEVIGQSTRNIIVHQPPNLRTVNQTLYPPVDSLPCAISIETKVSGAGAGDGAAQLGVWSSVYFARLSALLYTEQGRRTVTSHPLIVVTSDEWKLHIAVDCRDHIQILKERRLRDTVSWLGMYRLLASLRALAVWADGDMRTWFEDEVLGIRE